MQSAHLGHYRGLVATVIALWGSAIYSSSAAADPQADYRASLYEYFAGLEAGIWPYIPPIGPPTPQSESPAQAGDIYEDSHASKLRGSHRVCFGRIDFWASTAPLSGDTNGYSLSVPAGIAGGILGLEPVFNAIANAHLGVEEKVTISYPPPVKQREFTSELIHGELTDRSNISCQKLLSNIWNDTSTDPERHVLWVAQKVIYAKQNTRLDASSNFSAGVKADIAAVIANVPVNIKPELSGNWSGVHSIEINSNISNAIAWSPAFISRSHLDHLSDLNSRGFFGRLMERLGVYESEPDMLKSFSSDFPNDVTSAKELDAAASAGPAVAYDEKNPKHIMYIRTMDALYAASYRLYPKQ